MNACSQAFGFSQCPTPAAMNCGIISANTRIALITPTPSIATLEAIATAASLRKAINLHRDLRAFPENMRLEVVGSGTEGTDVCSKRTKGTEGAELQRKVVFVQRRDRKHKRHEPKGDYYRLPQWLLNNVALHKIVTISCGNNESFKYLITLSTLWKLPGCLPSECRKRSLKNSL